MKKFLSLIATLFTAVTLFAAARPSLDGRAVVADAGEMPKGLFARTIGYLPGDSVSVTNPATGSSVDVLILGAIDASEGVAILLSPEAADALNIDKDSNVQVKITKRAGSLDEAVTGTAVLSEDEMDYAPETSELSEVTEETAETPVANIEDGATVEDVPAITEISEEKSDEINAENFEEIPAATEEETIEGIEVMSEIPEDLPVEENIEIEEVNEETPVEEVPPVEETPAEELAVEEVPPVEEEVPAEEVITEELPPVEETPAEELAVEEVPPVEEAPVEESIQEEVPVEEPAAEETPVEIVEEEIPALEETPVEVPEEEPVANVVSEPVEEVVAEPVEAPVEEIVAEPVETPVEEVIAETVEEPAEEEYQPIVLVPAESNPPAEEVVEETAPVEVNPPAPVMSVIESAAVEKDESFRKYLTSEDQLVKGKYYIQIASLGNEDNLNALVKKYGTKYPLAIYPVNGGKTHRVLVGPLSMDEYGSVLEKFRAFGFKDAFLKRIK